MLYLIKTAFYNEETNKFSHALKIGYTNDLNSRKAQYRSDNPYINFLSTRDGDQFIEGLFHSYFKDYKLSIPGRPMNREWLEYNEEIIEKFNKIEIIDLVLNYFKPEDLIIVKPLLEYLLPKITQGDVFSFIRFFCEDSFINDLILSSIFKEDDLKKLYEVTSSYINNIEESTFLTDIFNILSVDPGWINIDREKQIISNVEFPSSQFNEEFFLSIEKLFQTTGIFEIRMKEICNIIVENTEVDLLNSFINLSVLPLNYRNYLNFLGPKKIRALGYYESHLKREIMNINGGEKIRLKLIELLEIGKKYTLKEIKDILRVVYLDLGLSKTPKATDIEDYFEVRGVRFYDPITKRRDRGYEILSLKE